MTAFTTTNNRIIELHHWLKGRIKGKIFMALSQYAAAQLK
jgi:hypothetical protein